MFSFETGVEVRPKSLSRIDTAVTEPLPRAGSGSGSRLKIVNGELSRFAQEIKAVEFDQPLDGWISRYEKCGQRGRFLWQWCAKGVRLTTLPCVEPQYRDDVYETKMLSILFGTLIDDIADQEQDREMLESAIAIDQLDPRDNSLVPWDERRRVYIETISDLWAEVWGRCKKYPRFDAFEHLLRFDNQQILNAMRYALLVNETPSLLNLIEHNHYQPHNMQIMFMATVDLCASPTFDRKELGTARQIFWHAQRMGRIGNMITTWEREVLDRDFSSGVFAHAIHQGYIKPAQLTDLPAHEIMSILEEAGCQDHFISEWEKHRDRIQELIGGIQSVDMEPYLSAFEHLIKLHLCSRGLM
jgi:hypothetical protein